LLGTLGVFVPKLKDGSIVGAATSLGRTDERTDGMEDGVTVLGMGEGMRVGEAEGSSIISFLATQPKKKTAKRTKRVFFILISIATTNCGRSTLNRSGCTIIF
jgi:hypothetical protein